MNPIFYFSKVFFFLQILILFFLSIFKTDVNFNQFNYPLANPSLKDRQILYDFYNYTAEKNDLFGIL